MVSSKNHPNEIYQRIEEFGVKNSANLLAEIIEAEEDDEATYQNPMKPPTAIRVSKVNPR